MSTVMHNTRIAIIQGLYQAHSGTGLDGAPALSELADGERIKKSYYIQCLEGINEHLAFLDEQIDAQLVEAPETLHILDREILRLALYENKYVEPMIPRKVIINEALDLTHELGTQEGHKLINAVLDQLIA